MELNKAYEIITDRIIAKLESGVIPWQKPWTHKTLIPRNGITKRRYSGINVFLLANCFTNPNWMTFNQVKNAGGKVRKGEKGMPVIFWKLMMKNESGKLVDFSNKDEDRDKIIPILKYYHVFNAEQCDDLPESLTKFETPTQLNEHEKLEAAENIVKRFEGGPEIRFIEGNRAFYMPIVDRVQVPVIGQYKTAGEYYSTLFHELVHSTGHATRLSREGVTDFDQFGSHKYAKEELVAEMGAAFLCAEAEITYTIDNSAAYIQSWMKVLKQSKNKQLLIQAASQAQKAADHILARQAKSVAA